jgi:hypothetical protein
MRIEGGLVIIENDDSKDQRQDYTSGEMDYRGTNAIHKAATTATTWQITKYTWVSSNCTRVEGPLEGSWDGRAALSWG